MRRHGLADVAWSQCWTERDQLGPYYVEEAPHRPPPNSSGLPRVCELGEGWKVERLRVRGRVLAEDCWTGVPWAMLDLWQADEAGRYSMTSRWPELNEMQCRGWVQADEDGYFAFETIFPASYVHAMFRRPRHIHALINATGYQTLVTQLYFASDQYLNVNGAALRYWNGGQVADDWQSDWRRRDAIWNIFLHPNSPSQSSSSQSWPN